mgnify:CR=1 FL=1
MTAVLPKRRGTPQDWIFKVVPVQYGLRYLLRVEGEDGAEI